MNPFLEAAIAMCEEAGAIHARYLHQEQVISEKGVGDLVTEVDRRAEAAIIERLRALFPDHAILAEESGRHAAGEDYIWYVDPLDGTTNYAHGFPAFCVSIALLHRGRVEVAAVHAVALGELFTAARGEGAWRNGRPIRVSRVPDIARSLVATGFSPSVREDGHNIAEFVAFLHRAQAVRRPGSAALDLAFVACGRLDGFWEYRLAPWDVAAGSLLVTEAGGVVTQIDGTAFDPAGRAILASNGLVHEEMRQVLATTPNRHPHTVS
ncbi:MAG: inositol monophosphatase [Candidatus Sericytochromatia bacterium]|nr:inositol monophosphatase [Candidatus Tanganyikabacteria bacterium]